MAFIALVAISFFVIPGFLSYPFLMGGRELSGPQIHYASTFGASQQLSKGLGIFDSGITFTYGYSYDDFGDRRGWLYWV